jgi:hypothetical protein
MELNFTELDDNLGNNFDVDKYNLESQNYWEKPKVEKNKKKKVSFDDILSNMNLLVDKNGVLRGMGPPPQQIQQQQQYQQQQQHQYPKQQQYQVQKQYPPKNDEPLDPSVKHSFIYNKYFKDYKDVNFPPEPEVRRPQTIEELNKMLHEDRIKAIQQRNRIAQIKSTKMLFTNTGNIQSSKNNLRMMSFR